MSPTASIVIEAPAVADGPGVASIVEAPADAVIVGVAAANMFGPLLRSAYGARFTARRLSRHLAKSASHDLVQHEAPQMETLERDEVYSR